MYSIGHAKKFKKNYVTLSTLSNKKLLRLSLFFCDIPHSCSQYLKFTVNSYFCTILVDTFPWALGHTIISFKVNRCNSKHDTAIGQQDPQVINSKFGSAETSCKKEDYRAFWCVKDESFISSTLADQILVNWSIVCVFDTSSHAKSPLNVERNLFTVPKWKYAKHTVTAPKRIC